MTILQQLRAATGPMHRNLEALPVTVRIAQGTISRDEYVALLRHMLVIHETFEKSLSQLPAAFRTPNELRSLRIRADLTNLSGTADTPSDSPAIDKWAQSIEAEASGHPEVWIGVQYVLEGSRMGSRMLVEPIARALGVTPQWGVGLDYHFENVHDRGQTFRQFMTSLDQFEVDADVQAKIVHAAVATFEMMYDIHMALGAEHALEMAATV